MKTPAQIVVLDAYRSVRRAGVVPVSAAIHVRDEFAFPIAEAVAAGNTPSRPMVDRFRIAAQWVETVVQRDIVRMGRLGRAS